MALLIPGPSGNPAQPYLAGIPRPKLPAHNSAILENNCPQVFYPFLSITFGPNYLSTCEKAIPA